MRCREKFLVDAVYCSNNTIITVVNSPVLVYLKCNLMNNLKNVIIVGIKPLVLKIEIIFVI